MNKGKIIAAICSLISLPIGFYMSYWILSQLQTDRLIWFLYWIYLPVTILAIFLGKLFSED